MSASKEKKQQTLPNKAEIEQIQHREEIKIYKKKLQILKDGVRKQRSDKAQLQKKIKQLKDRNRILESQIKRKDDKYQIALTEIQDLKNNVLYERNQREKTLNELALLNEKLKSQQQPKSLWGVGQYLGGFLKKTPGP